MKETETSLDASKIMRSNSMSRPGKSPQIWRTLLSSRLPHSNQRALSQRVAKLYPTGLSASSHPATGTEKASNEHHERAAREFFNYWKCWEKVETAGNLCSCLRIEGANARKRNLFCLPTVVLLDREIMTTGGLECIARASATFREVEWKNHTFETTRSVFYLLRRELSEFFVFKWVNFDFMRELLDDEFSSKVIPSNNFVAYSNSWLSYGYLVIIRYLYYGLLHCYR